jgi:hypothetical protein
MENAIEVSTYGGIKDFLLLIPLPIKNMIEEIISTLFFQQLKSQKIILKK